MLDIYTIVSENIPIPNGCRNSIPAIPFNNKLLRFIYTCAFDSLYEVVLHSFNISNIFKNFIQEHENENLFFKTICLHAAKKLSYKTLLCNRAQLIYPYLTLEKREARNSLVDCYSNPISLLHAIFKEDFCGSTKLITCDQCRTKKLVNCLFVEIPATILLETFKSKDIPSLAEWILMTLEYEGNCRKCKGIDVRTVHEVTSYIVIDVENLFQQNISVNSSDIPLEIEFKDYSLKLSGIVCFTPGHYISYLYSENNWEMRDDLKNNLIQKEQFKNLKISSLFYIRSDNQVSTFYYITSEAILFIMLIFFRARKS